MHSRGIYFLVILSVYVSVLIWPCLFNVFLSNIFFRLSLCHLIFHLSVCHFVFSTSVSYLFCFWFCLSANLSVSVSVCLSSCLSISASACISSCLFYVRSDLFHSQKACICHSCSDPWTCVITDRVTWPGVVARAADNQTALNGQEHCFTEIYIQLLHKRRHDSSQWCFKAQSGNGYPGVGTGGQVVELYGL